MAIISASRAIAAANTFTDAVRMRGKFNLYVWGTFAGTVTLQASPDNGTTWLDVATYTAPIFDVGILADNDDVMLRLGIKTGGYTSGTANVRISQ